MSKEDTILLQKILDFLEMAIATDEANGDKTLRVVSAKTNRVIHFYSNDIYYESMFNGLDTVLENLFKAQVFAPGIKLPFDSDAIDPNEYAVVKNPFYKLTKEEVAIKLDLEKMDMKQDIDFELAKRILGSLGFKLVSNIDIGITGVDGIPWFEIILDDEQGMRTDVYSNGRDGEMRASFDSIEELLAYILFTKHFIIDYGHGEYPKLKDNPFSGMTKEEAAIKIDLECKV